MKWGSRRVVGVSNEPDGSSGPSRDAGEPLNRLATMDDILRLLCACERYGRPAMFGGGADWHAAPCPAGIIEYWATRHPEEVDEWLEHYRDGRDEQPLLGW